MFKQCDNNAGDSNDQCGGGGGGGGDFGSAIWATRDSGIRRGLTTDKAMRAMCHKRGGQDGGALQVIVIASSIRTPPRPLLHRKTPVNLLWRSDQR
jgi:hypothetical protein